MVVTLALKGLKGGHSGCEIHLQRGNAIKLMARALWTVYLATPFRLAQFQGGSAHNAIPREAFATVVVDRSTRDAMVSQLQVELAAIQDEYRPADPGMDLTVGEEDGSTPDDVWDEETTARVLQLVNGLPHGVEAMSYDIPDLVETSTNLATVAVKDGALVIGLSSRSSVASALTALRQRIRATAQLAGAGVEEGNGYPGWQPDLKSHVLEVLKEVHVRELGVEPEMKAIHAGLECGLIGEKVPGMDMASFGPQIEFPHSPDERVKIDSVERFYRVVTGTLEALA